MVRAILSTTIYALLTLSSAGIAAPADIKPYTKGDMAALTISTNHLAEPITRILDSNGHQISLADLKADGRILIVDLWASWCTGCKEEMPTLAKLQSAYSGRVVVAPVSIDTLQNREKARAFLAQFPQLHFYQSVADPFPPALVRVLSPPVGSFPTAIIFDQQGKEIARMVGKTADWNGRDARALIDFLLSGHSAPNQKPS